MISGRDHAAYYVMCQRDYAYVNALIEEKKQLVEREICDTDNGDERNRGFRDGLRWVLNLKESLAKDLKIGE